MDERKFVFSRQCLHEKKEIASMSDKSYVPGTVVVNGVSKVYTEMMNPDKKSRFEDAVVVATGNYKKMRYTKESYV